MAEAARYLRLPTSTLQKWVRESTGGRGAARYLIRPPSKGHGALSFLNLVEAHVLRALRTDHKVAIRAVRTAIDYAERELHIDHLLVHPELRSSGGELLLDQYGKLTNLSQSGQLAMRAVLEQTLRRIEWDASKLPSQLFPVVHETNTESRSIVIDPHVAFGRPIIASRGVSTDAIRWRLDAGEAIQEVAEDYGVTVEEVKDAAVFERAA
ncbi:MAG: DUF433 domain-containing protein [Gemmatimonadaceae bacterium]